MKILLTGAYQYTDAQILHFERLGFDKEFIQYESDKVEHPEKYDAI